MLVAEAVVRILREHANGKPIKGIARDLQLSPHGNPCFRGCIR